MPDEPSLGLMPKLVNELFRLIKRVAESGAGILLVEQNVHQYVGGLTNCQTRTFR